MRASLPILIGVLLLMGTNAYADDFCRGFERGYIPWYKRVSGSSIDPITPICPIEPIKRFNDPPSDFEHGYIIGVEQGFSAGGRRLC